MTRAKQQTRAALVRKTRETTEAHLMLNGWFPVRLAPGVHSYPRARWGIAHDEHGCFMRDSSSANLWEPAAIALAARLPLEWAELRNGSFWRLYGRIVALGKIRRLP